MSGCQLEVSGCQLGVSGRQLGGLKSKSQFVFVVNCESYLRVNDLSVQFWPNFQVFFGHLWGFFKILFV